LLVTYYDKTYQTIRTGKQIWMAENLTTTKYQNGDDIPNITNNIEWNAHTSAYSNYNNEEKKAIVYGRLYNWYAVSDKRKLCPQGWHIPSNEEWNLLANYLGGDNVAGNFIKESGHTHWENSISGSSNSSGLTLVPGGYRNYKGQFFYIGYHAYLWSSTEYNSNAWYRYLYSNDAAIHVGYASKDNGFSVRCLKDD
jgi:uncharacterized protein (TIGR02145 family)